MLAIIVILLVYCIVVPLIDLTLNESARTMAKVIVYVLALLYVLYLIILAKGGI